MPRRNRRQVTQPLCPYVDEHSCHPCEHCGVVVHHPGYDLPVTCTDCDAPMTIAEAEEILWHHRS